METRSEQVFLSYARPDETSARQLYTALTEAGVRVWFDRDVLTPGAVWKTAIRKAIKESRYFLALLSSRSSSRKGFVHTELRQAVEILDQFPEDEVFLIPVRLDSCDPPLDRLNELQWVDLFPDWSLGQSKLLRFFGIRTETDARPHATGLVTGDRSPRFVPTVRIDGLYQSKRVGDYWGYLRFYMDGTVLSVTSSGLPEEIETWFNRDHPYVSTGAWTIAGTQIRFDSTSREGTVDYEGDIQGELLTLKIYSHINEYRSIQEYRFIPLGS